MIRHSAAALLFSTIAVWSQPKGQIFPVEQVTAEGNKLYNEPEIVAASGLQIGKPADQKAFDAARDNLVQTGLFSEIGYRYSPGPSGKGYKVTFEVKEVDQTLPYRFDRLDIDAAAVSAYLRKRIVLYADRIPANQPVIDRYREAVQAFIVERGGKEKVLAKISSDAPSDIHVLFYAAGAFTAIAEIHFKGNKAVDLTQLQSAIAGSVIGAEYRESRFRETLALAVTPIYEARGHLEVRYPLIETAPASGGVKGIAVTVTLDEGDRYSLGAVTVEGSQVPVDELAKQSGLKSGEVFNVKAVQLGQENLNVLMKANGFMKVSSTVDRSINKKDKTADVNYTVDPGPRFTFNKLFIQGLDIHGEHEVRRLWSLPQGKVLNASYPDFFLSRIREEGIFDDLGKTQAKISLNESAQTADVTLIFASAPARTKNAGRRQN
jgi:outer membrane protein insertion porin family